MLSRKMILFDEKPIEIDETTNVAQYIQCETGITPATCSENAECVVESLNQKGVCICHYGFYGDGVDCKKTQKVGVDIALMSLGILAGVIFLSILLRILGEYIYRLKKFLSEKMEKIQYQKKLEKQPGFSKNGQLPASQTKKQTNKHSKPVTSSHIECSLCCCWYSRKIGTGDDTANKAGNGQNSYEEIEEEERVYVRRQKKRVVNFSDARDSDRSTSRATSGSAKSQPRTNPHTQPRTARFDSPTGAGKNNSKTSGQDIELQVTEQPTSSSSSK